jgi:filamentous hemagglutinin family protein
MAEPRIRTWRNALLCGTALVPILGGGAVAQIAPDARPQGGQVVAGSASITQNPALTQVQQGSDRAVVDWRSFNIGRDHSVQFQQPSASSITLNRVTGPDPSVIAGRMTANGQIALVNQSGVLVTQGAQIQAQSVIISTADISNQAFMAGGGRLAFDRPGQPGARIENQGSITVREAGLAALVAPQVANRGTIAARMGRVVLGGAETHAIDLHGDGLLSLEVTGPVRRVAANGEALVSNSGSIEAAGGTVLLTAQAADGIVQDLVRAGGRISADAATPGGHAGRVLVAGTGGSVRIEGEVTASGLLAGSTGGAVSVQADRVAVAGTARIEASGRAGGGRVALGTDRRGPTAPRMARRTTIAPGATVRADATERGRGGEVLVNSTEVTAHAGQVSARGGPQGGDGGFVEVSGQGRLAINGGIDVSAPMGAAGTILLDPSFLTIVADDDTRANVDPALFADGTLGSGEGADTSFLATGLVGGFAGNLRLEASQDLTVAVGITKPSGDLALVAGGNLTIDAPVVLQGAGTTLLLSGAQIGVNALAQVSDTGLISLRGNSFGPNNVVQAGAGRFVGGRLDTSGNDSFSEFQLLDLRGDNRIGTLEGMDPATLLFRNVVPLVVGGGFTVRADTVAIDVEGGGLQVDGSIITSAGPFSAQLRASGDMVVSAGGRVEGDGLRMIAGFDFASGAPDPLAAAAMRIEGVVQGGFSDGSPNDVELFAGRDGMLLSGTATALNLDLVAGTAGITQTAGRLFVDSQLRVRSGGDVRLDVTPVDPFDGNIIGALGPSAVLGDYAFTGVGRDGLVLQGLIDVTGVLTLRSRDGGISQEDGSRLLVGALDASTPGSITLPNDNEIGVVRLLQATDGNVQLRNVTDLRIEGPVSASTTGAGFIAVDVAGGDLVVAGAVNGGDTVALRASGDLRLEAGSLVRASPGGSLSSVTLVGGFDTSTETASLAGGLFLAGTVGDAGGLNILRLGAGTGGMVQTAGRLVGQNMEVESGAGALLDRGGDQTGLRNAVTGPLTVQDMPGDFVLDNGTTDILLQDQVIRAANIGLRTEGALLLAGSAAGADAGAGRVSLRLGGLGATSGGALLRGGLVEIAPATPAPLTVLAAAPSPGSVNLDATAVAGLQAGTLRLGASTFRGVTETTATVIGFGGALSQPGTLDLRSLGDITQLAAAPITAGRLIGQAEGTVALDDAANQVTLLGDFAATEGFALRNSVALTLDGLLQTEGTASLTAAGDILATGAGRVQATTLTLDAQGGVTLDGANAVQRLGPVSAGGDVRFTNTQALLLAGAFDAAGFDVALDVTGALGQDAGGAVTARSLSGRATAGAALTGANALQRIEGFDAGSGDFRLTNATPVLTVAAGSSVTAAGQIGIVNTGAVQVDGTLAAAGIALEGTTRITIAGLLDTPGTVALTGASLVEESGAGRIQAGLLTVDAPGPVTLGGANAVGTLGPVTAGGAVFFTNTQSLVLAGAFDAAGFDVALDVTGALRQDAGATLVADALSGRATQGATFDGDNRLRRLEGFEAGSGSFVLNNTAPLLTLGVETEVTAAGAVAIATSGGLLVDGGISAADIALQAGGDLALRAPLATPGSVDLTAGGTIRELGAGRVTAGQLRLQSGGEAQLDGANAVDRLGPVTAGGDVSFRNTQGLVLEGAFEAAGFAVALDVAGALSQATGAALTAGALSGRATQGATLGGANALARIDGFDAGSGGFLLNNASPLLTVPGGATLRAGTTLAITQAGDLLIDGTVTGATTALAASGVLSVNGFSAIARTGDLLLRGDAVAVDGLISAAGSIAVEAASTASLAGLARGARLRVAAPTISFGGLDATATPVLLQLGPDGRAIGTLDALALEVSGGGGTALSGRIASVGGGPAAAIGTRSTGEGTPLPDPPEPTAFLFNGCPIGVPLCGAVPPVVLPDVPPPRPGVVRLPPGAVTLADSPAAVLQVLDPAAIAAALAQTRPSAPNVTSSFARDRAEAEDLAPPNVRGGDF